MLGNFSKLSVNLPTAVGLSEERPKAIFTDHFRPT
ncbi:hypothetical protein FHS25_007341 [Rhizobium laguerreae]|uniref:Uncharacterized protein n=1 Tax=Rhizobium laguerreae TaxID=1076926 RepID=A0ABR6GN07_9HYPH|nr:hypothetical protein [Rhizobium laguerreae]